MEVKAMSLQDRLRRLNDGEAGHPEFDRSVLQTMARIPIIQYLGDYAAFCDLQIITEIGEFVPYRTAARVIADLVWSKLISQEDLALAVSLLAAPVLRIREAYCRKDPSLLPRYTPQRAFIAEESLTKRLEGLNTLAGPPPSCHRMPILRFFQAVSAHPGGSRAMDTYYNSIQPVVPDGRMPFREAVYIIDTLKSPERTDLLCKIFVKPFAEI